MGQLRRCGVGGDMVNDMLRKMSAMDEGQNQPEQQPDQPADINAIAAGLEFKPTHKKAVKYKRVESTENMPPMSYAIADKPQQVVTITSDGKETQSAAAAGDVIMSGPSAEQYTVKAAKFPKLYMEAGDGTVVPEQTPRMVALYTGDQAVKFMAPWGEEMVLKPNDYLVKEAEGKYYRIAKLEYEKTYNQPGE